MNKNTYLPVFALGGLFAAVGVGAILFFPPSPPSGEIEPRTIDRASSKASEKAAPASPQTERVAQAPAPSKDDPVPTKVDESDYRVLDSGLKIADLEVGQGASPVEGQMVKVHYSGWLASDGSLFDSSVKRGVPAEFSLVRGGLIEGWIVGLADMKVGGKRQLIIPPELAYGDQGQSKIPANSTLIFDIELLELGEVRRVPDLPDQDWSEARELDDGVKVVVLTQGEGPAVQERSVVRTELTLWTSEGKLFASTYQGRGPRSAATFLKGAPPPAGEPLPGLGIALSDMKAGESRLALLPPKTAFGDQNLPANVPPNDTITAQIDLLDVGAPRVPPSAPPKVDPSALVTTDSGLQYAELEEGEGTPPSESAVVEVDFTGWTPEGVVVESSMNQANAVTFMISRTPIMPAWKEALSTMKPGGRRLLVVPPELGYGPQGRGDIPGDVPLTYVLELREVKRP
ncbi:MAG: hypothetical protein EA397_19120 [Deltaproteobacteria bacterium]|nr:MAG: hypothetical protein EA397_19120 [Deltaproteobacteria bacterium]